LGNIRTKLFENDPTIITGPYMEKQQKLLDSNLYSVLNIIPKPVIQHIHLTAAAPIDYLVNHLCYYDYVYFNQKDLMFKVSKKGCDIPGYIQVTKLRKYWGDSHSFD
jgi:hypothetical protein